MSATRPLRFHWSLSQAGNLFRRAERRETMSGLPDLDAQLALCRAAERCGIESLLMAIGSVRPDPLALSIALGRATERVAFMIACRSGLISPTLFVQQVNSASALLQGRVCINMVCGHTPQELRYYGDFLSHDERYERTDEFLAVARLFWSGGGEVNFQGRYYRIEGGRLNTPFIAPDRTSPEIFVGGSSEQAARLAARHADCLWRFPDVEERLAPEIRPVLEAGKEVGLLVSLIARPTRQEALAAAEALVAPFPRSTREIHRAFAAQSDSHGFRANYALAEGDRTAWLGRCLWTGAIPYLGAPAIALVGSYQEITEAILDYRRMGVTQFLFVGWPDLEEIERFGTQILPRIRARERSQAAGGPTHAMPRAARNEPFVGEDTVA